MRDPYAARLDNAAIMELRIQCGEETVVYGARAHSTLSLRMLLEPS
jgi:hypothetical protein